MQRIEDGLSISEALQECSRNGVKVTANTFKSKVGEGFLPEGRQRGTLYPVESVNEFIEQERNRLAAKRKQQKLNRVSDIRFLKAVPSDMLEIAPVIEAVFETYPDVARWQSWIVRNPDIAYMLKVDGKVVGVGLIVPLLESKIQDILAHQITPPTLPDEILQYEPGTLTDLYVRSVGIIPTATRSQKRHWAAILVRGLHRVIIGLGARGIVIGKIYSRSETADGMRILQHMGFTEIPKKTRHRDFMINVSTSGSKFIVQYNDALVDWYQRQAGE